MAVALRSEAAVVAVHAKVKEHGGDRNHPICSLTKGHAAIRALTRAMVDNAGNLPRDGRGRSLVSFLLMVRSVNETLRRVPDDTNAAYQAEAKFRFEIVLTVNAFPPPTFVAPLVEGRFPVRPCTSIKMGASSEAVVRVACRSQCPTDQCGPPTLSPSVPRSSVTNQTSNAPDDRSFLVRRDHKNLR
jgi:hypothetical protein